MIIDPHVHIFPKQIGTKAVKELKRQYGVNAIGSAILEYPDPETYTCGCGSLESKE